MEHLLAWLNEKRGRRSALSGALNINPGALSQWVQVPADRAADVEAFTNIPREKLRPDVFRKSGASA